MKSQKFLPNPSFAAQAYISSDTMLQSFCDTAASQPDAYWRELARALQWDKIFDEVLDWKMPVAKWFGGGQLNVSKNCLDRHAATHGSKTAIIWEGEPLSVSNQAEIRRLTYSELLELTCKIANAMKAQGVKAGDRVAIYMPMLPETVAAMLACTRIGAVHTVIFGGFSANAIYDRLVDCGVSFMITADGTFRRGNFLKLKPIVDEALAREGHAVKKVLVFRRDGSQKIDMTEGRDLRWDEHVLKQNRQCPAEALDAEAPLFILYTSGSTGKPKGLYHTQAGYLLWAHWTTRWLFDIKPSDIYWCTADCGWITGHTYVTYGPLSNGATVFMYEGAPMHPFPDRMWQIIDRHKITTLYTAPTAIRTFMRFGEDFPRKNNLSSLRLLGSVGEPINPEAWNWYREHIGLSRCPVIDTYWQTETGGAVIAPFPGASTLKPGSATKALPGIDADIVDPDTGESCAVGVRGALVIKKPWPGMARGIWGNPEFYEKNYWRARPKLEGMYFTSDFAHRDEDGDFWIEGRMDDVLNVSGHRIGSAEVESALVANEAVAEAAAVGIPDAIKGQGIVVFVTLTDAAQAKISSKEMKVEDLKLALRNFVGKELGSHAKPDQVRMAKSLPKTRSGKIMRRLLRELATTGSFTGDTSTLEDFSAQASLGDEDTP